jgi:hypothetical protein
MAGESGEHGKDLTVVVHDEDAGGKPHEISAGPGTPVRVVVERFYKEFGSEHQDGDRLYCLATGEDVFSHGDEHLGDYAKSSCSTLEWGFARPTGGA